ncbi:MAG: helix-turn-helix domain-containing protein [Bacilli bacterium]|mgnify:CR=1 FL=1|jgi:transcriptional regulator with XRE-family HTH domain|nr:helix-turn-helix domain-containing protein [Bacilli bacterium]MCH4210616.1 helix-turn-helix domain-containing protein [Bacilli bacterium]MCH4228331.1 helix-turn-helix domain-containing protein [Bacilli bacterium]MCH4277853.1 helix-turn-helix domain-containing protein [Bacilli bacterium]MCI2055097.1 helix-turn-helix domain-containing protein [Bacilli bacterium]
MENAKSLDVIDQLGKRVNYLRKERHLSQMELAFECELTKSYISDLERGERNPTLKVLNKISVGLGVTLEELFRGIVSIDSL